MSAKVTKWLLLKNAQESKFRKLKWCITKKGHQLDLLTEIAVTIHFSKVTLYKSSNEFFPVFYETEFEIE